MVKDMKQRMINLKKKTQYGEEDEVDKKEEMLMKICKKKKNRGIKRKDEEKEETEKGKRKERGREHILKEAQAIALANSKC